MDAVGLDGNELPVFICFGLLVTGLQHGRSAGAIDVGVQQAGPQTLFGKSRGEIDRDGRLADPALGARHDENAGNAGNPVARWGPRLALGDGFLGQAGSLADALGAFCRRRFRCRGRRRTGRALGCQDGADILYALHVHRASLSLHTPGFRSFHIVRVGVEDQADCTILLHLDSLQPVWIAEGLANPGFKLAGFLRLATKHAGDSLMRALWGAHICAIPIWP